MTFKKLRYNLLVFGLIALVVVYLAMTIFLTQPSETKDNQANSSQSADVTPPPAEEEDPGMNEEPDPGVTVPKKGLPLVIFALDILNNGLGYESTYTSELTNVATLNISVTQKVVGTIARGVNSAGDSVVAEKLFYHAENPPAVAANQVANYFLGLYSNLNNNTTQIVKTTNFDWRKQTYNAEGQRNEVVSTPEAISEIKLIEGLEYPVSITAKTVSLVWDKDDVINSNYRSIRVKVRNMSSLSQNFKDNYGASGDMKNIQYQSVEMEFKINKKNGYLYSVTRYESLKSKALDSFDVTSNVVVTQTFTTMNKAVLLSDGL